MVNVYHRFILMVELQKVPKGSFQQRLEYLHCKASSIRKGAIESSYTDKFYRELG